MLDADYDELRRDLDRVLYATINYQPERAAHVLGENALTLQRTALLALELREQIRRRR